jgi:hypothetical protein
MWRVVLQTVVGFCRSGFLFGFFFSGEVIYWWVLNVIFSYLLNAPLWLMDVWCWMIVLYFTSYFLLLYFTLFIQHPSQNKLHCCIIHNVTCSGMNCHYKLLNLYWTFSLAGFKIYLKLRTGICRSTKRMDGKTVIVTGANTGEDQLQHFIVSTMQSFRIKCLSNRVAHLITVVLTY